MELRYRLDDDVDEYDSRIKAQLVNLHPSISSVTLAFNSYHATTISVAKYLDALLKAPNVHLKNLFILSGKLEEEDIEVGHLPPAAFSTIDHLVFTITKIKEASLPMLSLYLPVLNHLEFRECSIGGKVYNGKINISMPNTAINKLSIDLG